jgi:hypothetical protein
MNEQELIGLGRRYAPDLRDRQYLIPKKRAEASEVRRRLWYSKGVMDQGATSQCVAYAGTKYLASGPILNPPPMPPDDLYARCQRVDEWEGEDYDGTSVRALFKVLKGTGHVSEYRWAFDCETVVNHVLTTGPVVMGTTWHMDMFDPDRWGYIQPKGGEAGGHAWLIIGAYRDRSNPDGTLGAVRMVNSWGENWGRQKGRAWITFRDLDTLIKDYGEACVAIEIRVTT